jgi:hypothetical protein
VIGRREGLDHADPRHPRVTSVVALRSFGEVSPLTGTAPVFQTEPAVEP